MMLRSGGRVTDAGAAFASRYELASDGQAARRTAEAILARASGLSRSGDVK